VASNANKKLDGFGLVFLVVGDLGSLGALGVAGQYKHYATEFLKLQLGQQQDGQVERWLPATPGRYLGNWQ
jgi:hypothetical protein